MPKCLFAILTQPRSGSYLLVDLLNQVPGIRCHPEIFKPGRLELRRDIRSLVNWTVAGRDERPIGYMRFVLSIGDSTAAGFKLFPRHNKRVLNTVISAKYIRKVVLIRHPLSRFISRLRAESTGTWVQRKPKDRTRIKNKPADHVKNSRLFSLMLRFPPFRNNAIESSVPADELRPETGGKPSLAFDPERFEFFIAHHNRFVDMTASAAVADPDRYITVDYEEVVSFRALERISHFLGAGLIDTAGISPTLQKQTREPLSELISNYDEMKQYLQKVHPSMLEQPGCPRLD